MRRAFFAVTLLVLTSACSFTKDPYLFTGLGDGSFILVPDVGPDTGMIADASSDGGVDGGVDLDSGEVDTGEPDAGPMYRTGNALSFTANDQGLEGSGPNALPHSGAARTVEAWVRNSSGGYPGRILGYGTMGAAFDFRIVVSNGRGGLILVHGAEVALTPRVEALGEDAWHHIAVTMTATTSPTGQTVVSFYIDGVLTSSSAQGSSDVMPGDAQAMAVGATSSTDNFGFNTLLLDELRIWNVTRTAAEIARDYRELIDDAPGLIGYYSMDGVSSGPNMTIANLAADSSTVAAPALVTRGDVQFVESTVF